MRYNRKSTHKIIVELRNQHPEWKLQQIADAIHKTKQWVRKALFQSGLPTKFYNPENLCDICRKPTSQRVYKTCSHECKDKKYYTIMNCRVCGKELKVSRKYILYQKKIWIGLYNRYCNSKCFYEGKRIGWS